MLFTGFSVLSIVYLPSIHLSFFFTHLEILIDVSTYFAMTLLLVDFFSHLYIDSFLTIPALFAEPFVWTPPCLMDHLSFWISLVPKCFKYPYLIFFVLCWIVRMCLFFVYVHFSCINSFLVLIFCLRAAFFFLSSVYLSSIRLSFFQPSFCFIDWLIHLLIY